MRTFRRAFFVASLREARYYEPNSGRFLSADPLGQASSASLYDFAGGDPVNSFDPTGRCPITVDVYGPQMSDRRTEFTQSGFPQSETQPLAFGQNSADPNPVNSGSNLLGNALGSLLGGLWDATGGAIVKTFNAGVDNIAGAIESAQSGDYTMAALQAVSAAGNVANLALAAVGVGEVVGAGVEALAGTALESAEAAAPGEIASAGKVATNAAETGASVAEATVPAEEATVAEASPSGSTVSETAKADLNSADNALSESTASESDETPTGATAGREKAVLPTKLYVYTSESNAAQIEASQLGLPGRTTYLTPAGDLSPLQAQIELALPAKNTAQAVFEVSTEGLDASRVIMARRVTGNVFNRAGGGFEYLFDGPIPLENVTRIR